MSATKTTTTGFPCTARRARSLALAGVAALVALALAGPAQALAAAQVQLASSHTPTTVPAGTYGKYTLVVSNSGNAPTSEELTVKFTVPAGLEITSAGSEEAHTSEFGSFNAWTCSVAGGSHEASCNGPSFEIFPGFFFPLEIGPGEEACQSLGGTCHIIMTVRADPGASPGTVHPTATACGGGVTACPAVASTAADDPIDVGPPPKFEVTGFDGQVLQSNGEAATQAGSHPHSASTDFTVSTVLGGNGAAVPTQQLKDATVKLPPGLLGNATAPGTCRQDQLAVITGENGGEVVGTNCPADSQVGVVIIHTIGVSKFDSLTGVYNMKRPTGSAANPIGTPGLFAFSALGIPIQVYAKLRSGADYGVTVIDKNTPQTLVVSGVSFAFWGVPADPAHDPERFCPGKPEQGCSSEAALKPFLSLPTSCVGEGGVPGGAVRTALDLTAWEGGADSSSFLSHAAGEPGNLLGATGCNTVPFGPTLQARPTTNLADSPSGLDVDLHVPQHEHCDAGPPVSCENAEAQLKDTTVTLPEGMAVNPAGANGLGACSEAQFGFTSKEGDVIHTTPDPATCPEAAKLGTVEVDSPLVDHPLQGSAYIAQPYQNPFNSLLALYITVDDPATGVVVKLAGEVHADPSTGRLTTTVLHNPQLPFEDFKLHFFGGAGGALRTPATCGTYETTSSLTPWSAPDSGPPAAPSDVWAISQAPGGGTCPASHGSLPNAPDLDAGSVSPIAASYSPAVVTLRRNDGSQEFSTVNLTLPPGMTGKLAGVGQCSDSALATAAAKSGREEEASPSCPASSRIGRVDVAAGAGPAPYNAQGSAYLTGPYKGAPLGMAIVTPATAGPFDLGTVVVRVALHLDPSTGQITADSDPIPSILQGIPLDIRSAQVKLDKANFTRNGTSCDPFSFNGSLVSTLNNAASLSERFQLGECTALSFKPKLGIRLFGGTKRGAHPALRGTVTLPEGGANVAKASVALPHSEFLDQGHIGTVCTRVQFAEGDGNGSACPAASAYGHAVATSPLVDYALEGNAYLRSSSNKLPDLVIALHGPPSQPVAVDVVGRIDSVKGGIRTSFEGVPDLPVSSFVLNMEGGKKGLLQNSTNICKGVHKATAEFDAQNGKVADLSPVLKNGKCGKAKRRHKRAQRRAAR